MIQIARPCTRQPQSAVRPSGLAESPIFLCLGNGINIASQIGNLARGTAHGTVYATGDLGVVSGGGNAAMSQDVYTPPAAALNARWAVTGAMTMLAVVRCAGNDNAGQGGPIQTRAVDAGDSEIYPYIDGKIYIHGFTPTRWVVGVSPGTDLSKPHVVVITCKSGAQALWIAGKRIATGTVTATPAISTTTNRWGSNGGLFALSFWDRVLTDQEIRHWSQSPWRLAKEVATLPMSQSGGGGLPTLTAITASNITTSGWRATLTAA